MFQSLYYLASNECPVRVPSALNRFNILAIDGIAMRCRPMLKRSFTFEAINYSYTQNHPEYWLFHADFRSTGTLSLAVISGARSIVR